MTRDGQRGSRTGLIFGVALIGAMPVSDASAGVRAIPVPMSTATCAAQAYEGETSAADSRSALWLSCGSRRGAARVVRVGSDGAVRRIVVPGAGGRATHFTEAADGAIWFKTRTRLVRLTPSGRASRVIDPGGAVAGLALGTDRRMWFTAASFVGQVEATGTVRRFAIPAGAKPSRPALFASPDGSLWFDVEAGWARVTGDGAVTLLPGRGFLETLTSDGHAVVGAAGRRLARVAPVGTRTVLPGRAPGEPAQRTPGPDGNLWFTLGAGNAHAGVVYRQSMADGSVTAFRLPGERMAIPSRPIAGPGNRLWTTQSGTTARLYGAGPGAHPESPTGASPFQVHIIGVIGRWVRASRARHAGAASGSPSLDGRGHRALTRRRGSRWSRARC
jgi:hypothetical protein